MQGLELTGPGSPRRATLPSRWTGPRKRHLIPQAVVTAANSAARAEAGSLSWVSHRPKVPSTLKFLEGVEVSPLLSLEFFRFLFLPSIELFIPVINHRGSASQSAVLNGVLTDSRHGAIPRQDFSPISLIR